MNTKTDDIQEFYNRKYAEAAKSISCELVLMTPAMADSLLAKNGKNRKLGNATVDRYCHYILTKQWTVNGETVVIDLNDDLLDAQHRLSAVRQAGVAIPVILIKGVEPDSFKTLNQGKLRSGADALYTCGEENSSEMSSALHWLHRWETNTMTGRAIQLSNGDVIGLLNEFPGIRRSVAFVKPRCQRGIHPAGPFAFLHFICVRKHPDRENFFSQVLTGAEIKENSPAYVLHRKLESRVDPKKRMTALSVIALTIKAWNATILERDIVQLRWGAEEPFPNVL